MTCSTNREKYMKYYFSIFLFLIPFFYPFRKIVQVYLPVKQYLIMYLPTILILFYLIVKRKGSLISQHLLIILIYYALMLVPSPDHITGLMWLINISIPVLFAGRLSEVRLTINDTFSYCLGTLVCSFLLLPNIISRFGFYIYYMNYSRVPFMYGDIEVGPNGWSQYLSVAIMLLTMQLIYGGNSKKRRIVLWIMFLLETFFLWITGARGSLVAIVGAFFMVGVLGVMFYSKITVKRSLIIRIAFVLFILSVIAMGVMIFGRGMLSGSRMADLSSVERFKIWRLAGYLFSKMDLIYMFFGIGTGGTGVYLGAHNNPLFGTTVDTRSKISHISAHNSYLDSLIGTGLIGLFLFTGYWIFSIWKILRYSGKHYYAIFPLYVMISGLVYNLFSGWTYCACIILTEAVIFRNCPEHRRKIKFVFSRVLDSN